MLSRIFDLIGTKHGASKELADHLGIKASLITDWKSGRIKSYPKYASQIAAYYGVSLDWLSGATDDKEQKNIPTLGESEESVIRRGIIAKLDEMSDEELEKLLGVIDLIQGSRNP
jgi:transcriptional regulator with XRE-family HTH domain